MHQRGSNSKVKNPKIGENSRPVLIICKFYIIYIIDTNKKKLQGYRLHKVENRFYCTQVKVTLRRKKRDLIQTAGALQIKLIFFCTQRDVY